MFPAELHLESAAGGKSQVLFAGCVFSASPVFCTLRVQTAAAFGSVCAGVLSKFTSFVLKCGFRGEKRQPSS